MCVLSERLNMNTTNQTSTTHPTPTQNTVGHKPEEKNSVTEKTSSTSQTIEGVGGDQKIETKKEEVLKENKD